MAASDYINQVQSMYISYYGRFADQAGLNYWTYMLDANGGNLDGIIQAFGTSTEATALYPATLSTAQKVTNLYNSLFGRDPDAAGLTFYTNLIGSGQATLVDIAKRVFDGATANDAMRLANKVNLSNTLTQTVGATANYSGDAAAATARALMSNVTDNASSITPVQNVMGAAVNSAKTTGTAITSLTQAIDATTPKDTNAPIASLISSNNNSVTISTNEMGYAGLYNIETGELVGELIYVPSSTIISIPSDLSSVTQTQLRVTDLSNNATTVATVIIDPFGYNLGGRMTGTSGNDIFYKFADLGDSYITQAIGNSGADIFYVNGGHLSIQDLGVGGSDVVIVAPNARVDGTLGFDWSATNQTKNLASHASYFNITAIENYNLDLSAATVIEPNQNGFYLTSRGTGSIVGSSGNDQLMNYSGNSTFSGGEGSDFFMVLDGVVNIRDLSDADNFWVIKGAEINQPQVYAHVTGNWVAGNLTNNYGGSVNTATLLVSENYSVDLTNAYVADASVQGFTINTTGSGTIAGSKGNDLIAANSENANLTIIGGFGADTISLSATGVAIQTIVLDQTATADTISNFKAAGTDKLSLSKAVYIALAGRAGDVTLGADFTSAGGVTAGTDTSATAIVFDSTNGYVYYNADGAIPGGLSLIAILTDFTALSATDFNII